MQLHLGKQVQHAAYSFHFIIQHPPLAKEKAIRTRDLTSRSTTSMVRLIRRPTLRKVTCRNTTTPIQQHHCRNTHSIQSYPHNQRKCTWKLQQLAIRFGYKAGHRENNVCSITLCLLLISAHCVSFLNVWYRFHHPSYSPI